MKKLLIAAAVVLMGWSSAHAQAITCGPGMTHTTCQCGDTVTANYYMTANLSCPTGHGLKVASNVLLNGGFYTISGSGTGLTDTYGIYLDGASQAKVKNVTVTGFERGVRIKGGTLNFIRNVTAYNNGNMSTHAMGGYGVDLADATTANYFLTMNIYGNADEGIHFGSNANYNRMDASTVCGNYLESLYLVSAHYNSFHDSTFGGDCNSYTGGNTGVYVKDSDGTYIGHSVFAGNSVHLTGDSNRTILYFNTYETDAVLVSNCYLGGGCPSGTLDID
jgi:hypothetical protein